ncbi:spherulin-2A [Manduca sexta]|uniref:spherulin-2A n=1 Tax=Manduca sexta TaxID=7130 RepID=UPI001890AF9E|nr:spherulin-2A [Manduca sexta]
MISRSAAILLLLPLVIHARIKVTIIASDKDGDRQIHVAGTDADTISDTEVTTFDLTDENLKNSIHAYTNEHPDDAFLKSPTPWGDLYKTYNWPEVTRVLTPLRAKILSVTNHPAVLTTHVYNNTTPKTSTFPAKIHEDVHNTLTSIWETTGDLTPQDIDYEFDIKAESWDNHGFTYAAKWGQEVVKTQMFTVGLESGAPITLEPKQSAVAELHVTKNMMRVQLDYEATLTGSTAAHFSKAHKGHRFWAFAVDAVMAAGNMRRSVKSSEAIQIVYYTEPKLIVRKMETNEMMFSTPMKFY